MQDGSIPRSNLKHIGSDRPPVEPRRLRWYLAFVVLTTLAEACFVATSLPVSLG